jgi:hypothetical protein
MNKTILVGLAILMISTSAASAWTPGAPQAMPGASSKDHEMRMKNLRDSGYEPKNDLTKDGTVAHQ